MTVARKPGHRGERGVSRKPLRREGRIASAEPVCSCAFFCALLHARPRVQRAPGFPCALLFLSRAAIDAKLGRIAPRDREAVSADTRCLKIESADIYRARMRHIPHVVIARLDRATQGGFNRSSQHPLYGSLVGIRRGFPPVFSSQGFSGAWY